MAAASQPGRNDPCTCGSGLKYKKCCLKREGEQPSRPPPAIVRQMAPTVEPHLELVPSVIWSGFRWRAIFSRLYYRTIAETFHEFLVQVVQWTLGEQWWKHQIKLPEDERHVVVRWKYDFAHASKAAVTGPPGGRYTGAASGPIWALLVFGYDLFCLQTQNKLPEHLVQKLRANRSFQSARYEVTAAAVLMRSGFEIEYLDDQAAIAKHCEFIATHRRDRVQLGVEAKSRRRAGFLHERGTFEYSEDARGLEQLFRKALKQKPEGLPFLIFVDLNLPSSPGVPFSEKPYVKDVRTMLARLGGTEPPEADPFNALVLTNYSYHLGLQSEPPPSVEWGVIVSPNPVTPLDRRYVDVVNETLDRYGRVPAEV